MSTSSISGRSAARRESATSAAASAAGGGRARQLRERRRLGHERPRCLLVERRQGDGGKPERLDRAPAEADGEHRPVVRVARQPAERLDAGGHLARDEHAPAQPRRRVARLARARDPEHDAARGLLVGRPVQLDDDGPADALERRRRLVGRPRSARSAESAGRSARAARRSRARRARPAGSGSPARRSCAARRGAVRSCAPARDSRDRAQALARAAQQRDVAVACQLGDRGRRIGRVHRRHGREDIRALDRVGERRGHECAPPLLVRAAVAREVELSQQDVVGAASRAGSESVPGKTCS